MHNKMLSGGPRWHALWQLDGWEPPDLRAFPDTYTAATGKSPNRRHFALCRRGAPAPYGTDGTV